jgi:hypothetical protein
MVVVEATTRSASRDMASEELSGLGGTWLIRVVLRPVVQVEREAMREQRWKFTVCVTWLAGLFDPRTAHILTLNPYMV